MNTPDGKRPTANSSMAAAVGQEFNVAQAMGGPRGLAEGVLPSFLFLLVWTITKDLTPALISALGVAGAAVLARLVARETILPGILGMAGVAINVMMSRQTGEAKDFFLPGLFVNLGYGAAFALSTLPIFKGKPMPLMGVALGPVTGEMFAWRDSPARLRAYVLATWLWTAMFAARLVVQVPLYLADEVTLLGSARLVMSTPLWILCAWGTYLILRRVPKAEPPAAA